MSSISIYSSQGSDYPASALVDVYLTEKPDPRFAQGTELFPRSDGTVALYPRDLDEDMRFYNKHLDKDHIVNSHIEVARIIP